MDDARRFLRYVTPGLVFLIEALVLLWVLSPDRARGYLAGLKGDTGVGLVLAALLGSGGLGFVFSVAHHRLHWLGTRGVINHTDFVKRLQASDILRLVDARTGNDLVTTVRMGRFEAWTIVTGLWNERVEASQRIKGAEPRAASLVDLMHSMGTGRVASSCAVLFACSLPYTGGQPAMEGPSVARLAATIALGVLLVWLHHGSYSRTGQSAQRVIEQVLHDSLADEKQRSGHAAQSCCPTTYVMLEPIRQGR
jgi:hypothetical protein